MAFHRGRLQQQIANGGTMLAAGVGPEAAEELIRGLAGEVEIAAINSPASVTLSGAAAGLERIAHDLSQHGLFARFLPVIVPYHSRWMDPIQDEFIEAVRDVRPGDTAIPLVSEVTGSLIEGPALDAPYWWRNIRQPVLFAAAIDRLIEDGYDTFLEIGPHPVLSAAIGECLAHQGVQATVLPSLRRSEG